MKSIRLATANDAEAVLNIYKPFIENTVITFENKVPSLKEFEQRMNKVQKKYPWFVCEIDNEICGYAYASSFNERAAYNWSVDLSIYIKPEYQGRKIGKALYSALLNTLKLQGFCNAYAIITSANEKSKSVHKSLGFKEMGTAEKCGYKMGRWLDVTWFELKFAQHKEEPEQPKSIVEICENHKFFCILKDAEELVG